MTSREGNTKLLETYKLQLDQINELLQNDPENKEYLSMRAQLEEAISLLNELTIDQPATLTKPKSTEWKLGDICQVKLPKLQNQWMLASITNLAADKSIATVILQKSHETLQVSTCDLRYPKKSDLSLVNNDTSHTNSTLTRKQLQEKRKKRQQAQLEYQERKNQEHSGKAEAWKSFQTKLVNKASPSIFHPSQRESIFKTYIPDKSKVASFTVSKRKHTYSESVEPE